MRRTLRAARAAYVAGLAPGEGARLEAALAAVLDANLGPGPVAVYRACGDEIDPGGLARPLLYPRVTRDSPLTFHYAGAASLVPGALGIPEPAADAPVAVPTIILVPLIAVDARGHRLGQGGGYYDRTLALLRGSGQVFAIGVAWDVQRVEELPADAWDAPLDTLATPSGWHSFTR
ncbi:5-formyltetrahydrofolate cyclo-ligase [Polymorphobacter sp. PAMC 29334]|uniref:5-formyltetrahydrofolate cyclo-ligase n=1 Tax=Polymorphobacter sp. PAMC 29334 TaxID=2862331 RepID=UPI001C746225|nr:5-formyltetrahydrofolate cyclo-ligase [Polymorphobacter sp. PAMC 29334]QYE33998.1 5-formyltetrahydrofolate cyclo-ligase [Polymorphobacter sp. PAMC 29334]